MYMYYYLSSLSNPRFLFKFVHYHVVRRNFLVQEATHRCLLGRGQNGPEEVCTRARIGEVIPLHLLTSKSQNPFRVTNDICAHLIVTLHPFFPSPFEVCLNSEQ